MLRSQDPLLCKLPMCWLQECAREAGEQELDAACWCGRYTYPAAAGCHFALYRAAGDHLIKATAKDTGWKQVRIIACLVEVTPFVTPYQLPPYQLPHGACCMQHCGGRALMTFYGILGTLLDIPRSKVRTTSLLLHIELNFCSHNLLYLFCCTWSFACTICCTWFFFNPIYELG